MNKTIHLALDFILIAVIAMFAIVLIFTPEPTIAQLARLLALSTLLGCNQFMIAKNTLLDINHTKDIKDAAKIVQSQTAIYQVQDTILKELKASTDKTTALVVSQAELLSRLTSSLVKNKEQLTADEVVKSDG